jgi:hypothetical protein
MPQKPNSFPPPRIVIAGPDDPIYKRGWMIGGVGFKGSPKGGPQKPATSPSGKEKAPAPGTTTRSSGDK